MKVKFYLAMVVAALMMTNCSQEESMIQSKGSTNVLTATIEGVTSRSSVTDGGVFSWDKGDAIAVGNSDKGFTQFVYDENGKFSASEVITPAGYAIYPYNGAYASYTEGTLPTVKLNDEYTYGSTNAPMLATIEENATSLSFKHLAGLMRFRVKNVPVTASNFTLTVDGKSITGEFTPETEDGEAYIETVEGETANVVKITFSEAEVKDVMDFYVPMPVGEYEKLTVTIGGKELSSGENVTNVITRGKLLLMPTMAFVEGELTLEGGNNVALNANEVVTLDVNDGEEVVVDITEGTTATLNLTAPDNSTEGLTISDGSEEGTESSGTSDGTLNVSATNAATLNINTPSLTVKLTSGEYDKVVALTAQQTLIIGENVTIGELVLKGGNVKLEGDLRLNKPLEVNQNLILDLNGHTLTTANPTTDWSAAVIVYKGNVTIKNGTIATNGTDAHKLMGAVWVRGTEDANVTIENGTFKGNSWDTQATYTDNCMATIYVSNEKGFVTINGGDFYCVQQTQVEGYNHILNYKNSFATKHIVVNGGTFHGMNPAKGNGVEVTYVADNAIVAETATEVFEVLSAEADVITLAKDMTIVSPLVFNGGDYTFDLNGKTLTTADPTTDWSAAVIVYKGNVTIKNGTIATNGTDAHKLMGAVWVRGTEDANVTIENGIFKGNSWNTQTTYTDNCMATIYVSNENGFVTINGGDFYCVQQTQVEGYNHILNYKNSFATKHIVVNGGTFYGMNPAKGNGEEVTYVADNATVAEIDGNGGVKIYKVSISDN